MSNVSKKFWGIMGMGLLLLGFVGIVSAQTKLFYQQGGTSTTTAVTQGIFYFNGTTGNFAQDTANLIWNFNTNTMGLGTTSPSQRLSVQCGGLFSGNLSLANLTATGTVNFTGTGATTTISGVLSVCNNAALVVNQAATANSLYITNSGNVGIGTTSPASLLSVQGNALFSGNLSLASITATGTLTVEPLTSALVLTDAGGLFAEYTGTSCTNQFPRSLSVLGAATCATVDISGDTNLTAGTNITLTGDDLSVDDSFLLNTVDIGTGVYDFGGATSLELPNGASPTVDTDGECAIDTTSGQLKCDLGTDVLVIGNGKIYPAFAYATSTAYTGTTTIPLGPAFVAETWNGVKCFTDTGALNISFNDGTNRMDMLNASTTVGDFKFATNNAFTASEKRYVDIGTPASSATRISCTV